MVLEKVNEMLLCLAYICGLKINATIKVNCGKERDKDEAAANIYNEQFSFIEH